MKTLFAILFLALAATLPRAEAQTNTPPDAFVSELRRIETERAALKQQVAEIQTQATEDTKRYDMEKRAGKNPEARARTEKIKEQSVQKYALARKITALNMEEIRLRRQHKIAADEKKELPQSSTIQNTKAEVAPNAPARSNLVHSSRQ